MSHIDSSSRHHHHQLTALLVKLKRCVLADPSSRPELIENVITASSEMLARVARRCIRYGDLPATIHEQDVVDIARSVERAMVEEWIDGPSGSDEYLTDWEGALRTKTQLVLNAQFPRATKARHQRALVNHRQAIIEASIDPMGARPSTTQQR